MYILVDQFVIDVAICLLVAQRQPGGHGVGEVAGKNNGAPGRTVFRFHIGRHVAIKVLSQGGAYRLHLDRAGNGILAEQKALWPTQHLNPLQVYHRLGELATANLVKPIHVHANRLLKPQIAAGAYATDINAAGQCGAPQLQTGHLGTELFQVGDTFPVHCGAAHHGNGHRSIHQTLR